MHGLAQLAWVRLIGHIKQNGLLGRSKALTPVAAGLLWRIPAKHVATMLEGATGDGALAIEDGEWVLTKWAEYQETDSTAGERMRRYREKLNTTPQEPTNDAIHRNVTAVTRNPAEQPRNPSRDLDLDLDLDLKKAPSGPKKARASTEAEPGFDVAWAAYPKRSGSNPRRKASQAWNARVKEHVEPAAMLAGVQRYRAHVEARGDAGTEFVMQAARFFGPGREWETAWEPPSAATPTAAKPRPRLHLTAAEVREQYGRPDDVPTEW